MKQIQEVEEKKAEPDTVQAIAEYFVDAGRVVPGISVDPDGRARSWWWPLPTALDRELIRSTVASGAFEDHHLAASSLAQAVDHLVRTRMNEVTSIGMPSQGNRTEPVARTKLEPPVPVRDLLPKKAGKKSVPEAWVYSLVSTEPYLPATLDVEKVAAFAKVVEAWVRSGAASQTRARVVLRLREPVEGELWHVDVLVQDTEELSVVVEASALWEAESPFSSEAIAELLAGLGKTVRIAPELGELLNSPRAASIEISSEVALAFVHNRVEALSDAGIGVRLPGWWSRRERLRLRARVKSITSSSNVFLTIVKHR